MKRLSRFVPLAAAGVVLSTPALAHHPLGGQPMETFSQGLLSGVGHPLIGFDHLFFVLAMGVAAMLARRPFTAPLGYLAAMTAGVGLVASGLAVPFAEPVVAASVLIAGGMVLSGRRPAPVLAAGLFAGLGLFHGVAFGGVLGGEESASGAVLAGYLVGLGTVQYAIAVGAGLAVRAAWSASASAVNTRLAGALVAGVGALLVLEQVEGALFNALGLAG